MARKSRKPRGLAQSTDNEEGSFRLRPGKPRSSNDGIAYSKAFKMVAHYARNTSSTRRSGTVGARVGRRQYSQRCAVRIIYAPNRTPGQWRAHGRYIERDSATQQDAHAGFDRDGSGVDVAPVIDRWQSAGDPRMWKMIISPEFGERVDLTALTREMLAKAEKELGTKLQWVAVNHFNTEHPHVHVALRGVKEDGAPLLLPRQFIRSGWRSIAEDACTRQLGHRTELDAMEAARREVNQQRFTPLDRDLLRRANFDDSDGSGRVEIRSGSARERLLSARLTVLARMGLSRPLHDGNWLLPSNLKGSLGAIQRVADHQRILAACGVLLSDSRLPFVVERPGTLGALEGRLLVHGQEEHSGRQYFLLEGTDAQVHLMYHTADTSKRRASGQLRPGSFIRLDRGLANREAVCNVSDRGDAEALLKDNRFLQSQAQRLIRKGIINPDQDWGGWLGRYNRAVANSLAAHSHPPQKGTDADRRGR